MDFEKFAGGTLSTTVFQMTWEIWDPKTFKREKRHLRGKRKLIKVKIDRKRGLRSLKRLREKFNEIERVVREKTERRE